MEYGEEEENLAYLATMEQRDKEEMEFYTDLAVQEMQRWIEVCRISVTKPIVLYVRLY